MAIKLYEETNDKPLCAAFVLSYISDALVHMSTEYIKRFGSSKIVYAGGVMSNAIIKNKLKDKFDACFATPMLSCDNAVGIAVLASRKYKSE